MMREKKAYKKIKVFPKKQKNQRPENEIIKELQEKYKDLDLTNIKKFSDFPLSINTIKGLKSAGFIKPTEIQKETLMLALQGKDILGAAQTGSGKTLAFIIPVLEKLFCKSWTQLDGLGALIITPTRELAYQIFETLREVGSHHKISAGLIIGGKDLNFERRRMDQCNIIVCTPGRLLQHMDETPLFDAVNLQVLVLDEADRCLDMGFEHTMNAIIANLPLQRQTLLFSATQTKSVKDLARLSLKDPSYISVHENAKYSTPSGLQQSYVLCELKDKVSILWNFIKSHLKQKCIIFLSSCHQVKYIFELFSKLRPGTSLVALYGKMHQLKRMAIYESFSKKSAAVLFATDLAARGLDFPSVNWVVQADCPEDADSYIHRVGRTARFHKGGESLLLLMPSELVMLKELEAKRIPIEKIEINPLKINDPKHKILAYLSSNPALKESAKRAFLTYIKSVFLMKNKKIFNVESLDFESFANSLGLSIAPRIRFLQRINAKKNQIKNLTESDDVNIVPGINEDEDELEETIEENDFPEKTVDKNIKQQNKFRLIMGDDDNLAYTNKLVHIEENYSFEEPVSISKNQKPQSKAASVKEILKQNIKVNKKITFDETGEQVGGITEKKVEIADENVNKKLSDEILHAIYAEIDPISKQLFKEKVKLKHKEAKKKLKEKKRDEQSDEFDENESDVEPDLSWLPDPDKIYEKNETSDQEESMETQEIPDEKPFKKRKSKKDLKEPPNKKQKKKENIESNLSVTEAEELALLLLKN